MPAAIGAAMRAMCPAMGPFVRSCTWNGMADGRWRLGDTLPGCLTNWIGRVVAHNSWAILPCRDGPHDVVDEPPQPRRVLVIDVLRLVGHLVVVLRVAK